MSKTKFRAPVEHSILLACFVLVWLGPFLKLAGILTCSWWLAFLLHEVLWVLAVLAFLVNALLEVAQADAN